MNPTAHGRELYRKHVNPRMAEAISVMGFSRDYKRGHGAHLYDTDGNQYLDFISGYGSCFLGRNHPAVAAALHDAIDCETPSLVQMDVSALAGKLAKALLDRAPRSLEISYFASTGAEAVETAIKFSRRHTGKRRVLYLENAFHGVTSGALSLNGDAEFRDGFGPLLPGTTAIPINDVAALEAQLAAGDVAAVVVEPIQGQGLASLDIEFARVLSKRCAESGALVVADEVMTGLGRTGRWFACEHLGLEPDLLLVSKTLSGGFVPVSAVLMRRDIYDSVFSSVDRAGIHASTFNQNKLAMVAGLTTLEVLDRERLVEKAAALGTLFRQGVDDLRARHECLGPLVGKGLLIGIELKAPAGLLRRLDWIAAHKVSGSLFALKVSMDLMARHRILTLPSGRDTDIVSLMPPVAITERDVETFIGALDDVLTRSSKFPGIFIGAAAQLTQHAIEQSSVVQKLGGRLRQT